MSKTIAILGAGASGMMAALHARPRENRVILLERQARAGRKLAVTGNGRCNLSNQNVSPAHYHGADPDFVRPALAAFPVSETLEFFRKLGLLTVTEPGGRVYPFSDQAGSVVDVLRFALESAGAELRTGWEVRGVQRDGACFLLRGETETLRADRLIVAGGGAAGTRAGGGAGGYDALAALGHRTTALYPALVQLKTDNAFTRPLKGVRADAVVTVEHRGAVLAQSAGEVQFTDYGVSGPAVFDVSRAAARQPESLVVLDLMRPLDEAALLAALRARRADFPGLTLENLLTGLVHNRLGRTVIARCGLALNTPLPRVSDGELEAISRTLKRCELPVRGTLGFEGAQVTAGGIATGAFDPETLVSRLVPGLFACGEVLDVDGDCGGYNLQWAWSSGALAGRSAGA